MHQLIFDESTIGWLSVFSNTSSLADDNKNKGKEKVKAMESKSPAVTQVKSQAQQEVTVFRVTGIGFPAQGVNRYSCYGFCTSVAVGACKRSDAEKQTSEVGSHHIQQGRHRCLCQGDEDPIRELSHTYPFRRGSHLPDHRQMLWHVPPAPGRRR